MDQSSFGILAHNKLQNLALVGHGYVKAYDASEVRNMVCEF